MNELQKYRAWDGVPEESCAEHNYTGGHVYYASHDADAALARSESANQHLREKMQNLAGQVCDLKTALIAFRDHVNQNAVTWAPGMGSHHHPIWSKVAAALDAAGAVETQKRGPEAL